MRKRSDRKSAFLASWRKEGLSEDNLHWFNAIEGAKLPSYRLYNFRTAARTHKARAGRVGCYCSHVAAIKKAIDYNHFPLLVLEDDAIPSSPIYLNRLFDNIPNSATLLYFGALPVKGRKRTTICQRKYNKWFIAPDTKYIKLYGGHAYGIYNKKAAEEIVDYLDKHKMTFDSALIRYTKENQDKVWYFCPFKFYQREGYSNIEGAYRAER